MTRPAELNILFDASTSNEVRKLANELSVSPAEVIQRAFRLLQLVAKYEVVKMELDGVMKNVKVR